MGLIVPVENESGWSVSIVPDSTRADAVRAEEKQRAVEACLRVARELQATDPQRAATLEALAADESAKAYDMYREVKQDGRPAAAAAEETSERK